MYIDVSLIYLKRGLNFENKLCHCHHQHHLYTWKSPGDGVRNQIDYITMNKRFHNAITQVKGYPGADCGSDHVPIVATMKVKLRTLKRKKADVKLQLYLLTADNEYSIVFPIYLISLNVLYTCNILFKVHYTLIYLFI